MCIHLHAVRAQLCLFEYRYLVFVNIKADSSALQYKYQSLYLYQLQDFTAFGNVV